MDFWNGSARFQEKIVDDLIKEILPEHIRSMIISYDVIADFKEPVASDTVDETGEQDAKSNLRDEDFKKDETIYSKSDDGSVDPQLQEINGQV